jgi:hypothetical protein
MIKLALPTLLLFSLLCSRALAQASKVDSSEMKTLRIDPSTARGASASQIFDEVKYIPLETTKESLFGSISQLKVTTDYYIIYDYDTKAILIFDKQGKYKTKINGTKIEKDPDNKNSQDFYGFSLVTENDQQVIQLKSGKYNFYFDLNAKLIRKVKGEKYVSNEKFSDGTVVDYSYTEKKDKDSTNYEISLVKDTKKVASYFPYSMEKYKTDEFYSGGESITNYGVPDELFFIRAYEYNIYKLTPKKLLLAYNIIFPANISLPADFRDNPLYKGKRREYFDKNPKVFFAIGSVYQLGNDLFLKGTNWSWGGDEKKALIYNLKTSALTSVSDIEPDSLSQFLPVTDAGIGWEFAGRGFLLYEKKYFYTSYSSLALFGYKEQSAGKNRKYDALLTEYFKTQNKKSNPVLIQLKPKGN